MYLLNLASEYLFMPVLRCIHECSPPWSSCGIDDSYIDVAPRLDQCAGAQIMTARACIHQRRPTALDRDVHVRAILEQCAGDLIEMV